MRDIFPGDKPRDKVARAIGWTFLFLSVTGAFTAIVERNRLTRESQVSIADGERLNRDAKEFRERQKEIVERQTAIMDKQAIDWSWRIQAKGEITELQADVAKLKAAR